MFFEILRPHQEVFLLRADPSETQRLTVGDSSFTMSRMATHDVEILVFICGLDMQVRFQMAIFQVGHSV